jgi:hypothetical protein
MSLVFDEDVINAIRGEVRRYDWLSQYGFEQNDLVQICSMAVLRVAPKYGVIDRLAGLAVMVSRIEMKKLYGQIRKNRELLKDTQYDHYLLRYMLINPREEKEPDRFRSSVVHRKMVDREAPYRLPVIRLDTGERYDDVFEAARKNVAGTIKGMKAANASKLGIINSIKYGTKCAGTQWAWA